MSRWQTISITRTWVSMRGRPYDALPDAPGIYVVYSLDEPRTRQRLIYVGSAESLLRRWRGYLSKQCNVMSMRSVYFRTATMHESFSDLVVKFREARAAGEHLMGEYRLIRRLLPPWNSRSRPAVGGAENRLVVRHVADGGIRTMMAPLGEWADGFLINRPESLLGLDAVYGAYCDWAKRHGFRIPAHRHLFVGGMFEWFENRTGRHLGRVRSPEGVECYRGIAWSGIKNEASQ